MYVYTTEGDSDLKTLQPVQMFFFLWQMFCLHWDLNVEPPTTPSRPYTLARIEESGV